MVCSSFVRKASEHKLLFICGLLLALVGNKAYSQAEIEAWGNLKGIRTDGELMKIESSIDFIKSDWSAIAATAKERQRPKYRRDGNTQTVTTRIDSFYIVQKIED